VWHHLTRHRVLQRCSTAGCASVRSRSRRHAPTTAREKTLIAFQCFNAIYGGSGEGVLTPESNAIGHTHIRFMRTGVDPIASSSGNPCRSEPPIASSSGNPCRSEPPIASSSGNPCRKTRTVPKHVEQSTLVTSRVEGPPVLRDVIRLVAEFMVSHLTSGTKGSSVV
jgi:hypothetical protein